MEKQVRLMQGNEAIAEGALYAGARFYAGYPITPSSEIAEICSRKLPEMGGIYLQMEDEIASIAAVIGASLAGAKAFTATSGPGFSLMQENLGLAVIGEVPCVVVNVQRVGPSTGLATKPAQSDFMQARWGRHGDQALIALCPASVAECFSLSIKAFDLSGRFRVPVILLPDEIIAHMRESVEIPSPGERLHADRAMPAAPAEPHPPFPASEDGATPLFAYGSDTVFHVSSSMHGPDGYSNNDPENASLQIRHLHEKIDRHRDEIVFTRSFETDGMDILVVSAGAPTRAARAAAKMVREKGIRAGVLQLQTIWPFAEEEVSLLAEHARTVIVAEMNYAGQLAGEVMRVLGRGKDIRTIRRYNGTVITPGDIVEEILKGRCAAVAG